MSFTLHGVGVSRGIAIGQVHVIERGQIEIPEYCIDPHFLDEEVKRFDDAVLTARQQLRAVRDHIPKRTSADIAAFIDAHLLMLEDAALTLEPIKLIRETRCNAEWALKLQRDALVRAFEEMDDPYLSTRKDDVVHVVNRIQRILLNEGPLRHEIPDSRLKDYVIIADDLTPADTVLLQHEGIVAFATEYGGPTSHTSILARSFGIPCIVGLHQARSYLRDDDLVIVDGRSGCLLADPDEATLAYYRQRQEEQARYYESLGSLKEAPSITRDGVSIELNANIELPLDYDTALAVGAAGIGLYRTEFLFMNRPTQPDEDEHFQAYTQALLALKGLPVTIRTLDLGADKQVDGGRLDGPVPVNPALGLRAIRLCLKEPTIFRPQLRAILRASSLGPVRLMIPMLSNLQELGQVLQIIRQIREELDAEGIPFDPNMPVGAMIEVPAAALCADAFARHVDFFSIGTNDLIQYTIAIDRVDDEVNYLYDPLHPGVLRLIHMTIEAGERHQIPVAMCGEMASEIRCVRLLMALGLRNFSLHPSAMLEVKRVITMSHFGELRSQANEILDCPSGFEVSQLLERLNASVH